MTSISEVAMHEALSLWWPTSFRKVRVEVEKMAWVITALINMRVCYSGGQHERGGGGLQGKLAAWATICCSIAGGWSTDVSLDTQQWWS